MGLDQYATARRGEAQTDDEGYTYYEDSMELAYWRKHLTYRDGWKAYGMSKVMTVSLIVKTLS